MADNLNEKKKKKVKISTVFFALVAVGIIYMVVIGVMIYGFGVDNKITKITTRYIPYPAALINYTKWVMVNELEENLLASKHFYENQDFASVGLRVDFSTEDGKKRLKIRERELLNKLVENKIIEILLSNENSKVTQEAVDQEVSRKLSAEGSWNSTNEKLAKLYGWTLDDFKEKIVKPDLYQKKLMEVFESRYSSNKDKEEKIAEAEKELEVKKEFADVAREYSEGVNAKDGGAMGWFKKEQLIPGLMETVFSLEAGKTSGIIETELGYHIVRVEERQIENGEEKIRISQIFVRKHDFSDWLEGEMKKFKIMVLLKDYYWDKGSLSVQFSNTELKDFENKAIDEFQGDASVLN